MAEKQSSEQKVPKWASNPFHRFVHDIEDLEHILRLSVKGITMITGVPKAVEWLEKTKPLFEETNTDEESTSSYEKQLDYSKKEAALAQKEVDNGFPFLHAQAVISLWGILESQIRNFLATWLANEPKAMLVNQVQKLKVQLGDYESLSPEERPYYIVNLLERDLQLPLKQGVNRFESMFELFGIGGTVDESIKRDLFEMNQIRNVLVHRQGIADKKLALACPWLNISIGQAIVVSDKDYHRYSNAIFGYVVELMMRTSDYFGESREGFEESI